MRAGTRDGVSEPHERAVWRTPVPIPSEPLSSIELYNSPHWNTKEVVLWADKESTFVESLLYAGSIQFTALLMTLHRGGRVYLLIFAVLEFGVNMIHYRPWDKEGTGIDVWVIDILLSFAIAFSIYSYSEIFTTKRQ